MNFNQVFGIVTLLTASASFWMAYRTRRSVLVSILWICIGGFLLRLNCCLDFYLHQWDESYHALVAKNMILHPFKPTLYEHPLIDYNFKRWTENHIWVHKPPLPLWLMSGSMAIFGVNEFALRLPSLLLSTLGIYLTYRIVSHFFTKETGLLAAFFHAINGLILEIGAGRVATDHIDLQFLVMIQLAMLFIIQFDRKQSWRNALFVGVFAGLAILCKWLPALIIYPFWFLIELNHKRFRFTFFKMVFSFLICLIIFLPWQIYIYSAFPVEAKWESDFNKAHVFKVLAGRSGAWYWHLDKARIIWNELIYIYTLLFIIIQWKAKELKKYAPLLIFISIPYVFFSFVATKMQGYLLFTAPAIFGILAWGILYSSDFFLQRGQTVVSYLIVIITIGFSTRYTLERMKLFASTNREPEWVHEIKNLDTMVKGQNAAVFNLKRYADAMFYNDHIVAYKKLPTIKAIEVCQQKGYDVYVISENSILPDSLSRLGIRPLILKQINRDQGYR